jgi:CHAT domain-containing protein/Tfp pilus assembly protein PilF
MKLHNTVLLGLGAALGLLTFPALGQRAPGIQPQSAHLSSTNAPACRGIVVETVTRNLEGDKAGLEADDCLLSWARGDTKGELASPFDLSQVESEQAPQGTVTVTGLRGAQKEAWALGPLSWGIEARPNLTESLASSYHEGHELVAAGKPGEAADLWRSAADKVQPQSSWLNLWFLFRSAATLASAHLWQQADARYEELIEKSVQSPPATRALLLRAWAQTFQQRADWASAEKHYQEAAAEAEKSAPNGLLLAGILVDAGQAAWQRRDVASAEKSFSQAMEIQQRPAPGSRGLANSLNGLGVLAFNRGDLAKAEELNLQCLAIREKMNPGSYEVAVTLNNIGSLAAMRGDLAKADGYYRRVLDIEQKLVPANPDLLFATLTNLGNVAFKRRDLVKAEEYFRQSLSLREKLAPNTLEVAKSFNNLGNVAEARGDFPAAEECYRQALVIKEKLAPVSLEVADSLSNLGLVALDRGDLAEAEEYQHKALLLYEKLAPDGLGVAEDLTVLGNIAVSRRDLVHAEQYYQQALKLEERLSPTDIEVVASLRELGNITRDLGDPARAEEYYRRALAIAEKIAPESKDYAETLAALAGTMLHKGQLDTAAPLFEKALNALEGQIRHLGGGEAIRSNFRAQHAGYYRDYMDLLMQQKQPEKAFHVLERSRAQTLLEMLAEAHIDVHRGADQVLMEQEHSLEADINAKLERRLRLQSGKHTEEQTAAINKELEELFAQYDEVRGEIRTSSPSYAALTQPQALGVKEIEEQLLDADTLLLEYSLGEERSYVWAISVGSMTSYELPGRAEIEKTAGQVYDLLTARNRASQGETGPDRRARLANADKEFPAQAAALSRMVLGPLAAQLKTKRLLIVSDGALEYIPFALLPEPTVSQKDATLRSSRRSPPLVVGHEVISLPSASVLAVLRLQMAGRKAAPKAVAVLADPVFAADDARVGAAQMQARGGTGKGSHELDGKDERMHAGSSDTLTRSIADVALSTGKLYLPRLRFTRQEAQAIMAVTPPEEGMEALDFRASRATATSPEITQYRMVHFATHGLLDSTHPELSGLVFSLVDEQGRPQKGFLDLADIYNLNLPADLVVLSACETGLGREVQGEGLVGLTRGFMYAGASRVVASSWKVDDVATAQLMGRFYRAMEKEGMRPAVALRQAQIEMWKQKDWKAPYYWAAFQMQGEWK